MAHGPDLRGRLTGSILGGLLLLLAALPGAATAQDLGQVQSPILTIDSDRFFSESDFGRRTEREFESEGAALAAENRALEADLADEEKALTRKRDTMPAEEFRALADAFDEKVQRIRREQQAKLQDLQQRAEARRRRFLDSADPILSEVMRAAGAAVIVERRSVFASAPVIDVTEVAIQRMNERVGDGGDLLAPEPAEVPAPAPRAEPGMILPPEAGDRSGGPDAPVNLPEPETEPAPARPGDDAADR
ncbi:OmpH family outer membrane protein [Aquicoccus sp. SCR17]|nr:OmpH family outer membrane protein [Carideicomes alvinocaridis]